MTRQTDVERVLETWLADGPSELPDRAIASILTQLDETNQRKSFWLPGGIRMNRMMLAVGGLAAVVLVVAIGTGLYFGGNRAGIGGQPTATPLASATQSPTQSAPLESQILPPSGPIEAGRYFVQIQNYRFSFTVPDGWQAHAGFAVSPADSEENASHYASLGIWGEASNVHVDPCNWQGNILTPPPGPGVDEFAEALAAQSGWTTTQPADLTVDGYQGKRLQLMVPDDIDFADCDLREFRSWTDRWYRGPGQIDDVRLLDVDGTRQLFLTTYFPGTSSETLADLAQIADSLEIEAVDD